MGRHSHIRTLILLCLALAIAPGLARAQEPTGTITGTVDVAITSIPDAVGYISGFSVPQCGECGVSNYVPDEVQATLPDALDLLNGAFFGELINWLLAGFSNTVRAIICVSFTLLKLLTDILTVLINILLLAVNIAYRVIILLYLVLRNLLYAIFYITEALREALNSIIVLLSLLLFYSYEMFKLMLDALGAIIQFAAFAMVILLQMIGVFSWLLALVLGAIFRIMEALGI